MSCLHGAMIERMTRSNPVAASSLEWPLSARRAWSCPTHEHQPSTRHRPVPARTAEGVVADARLHPLHARAGCDAGGVLTVRKQVVSGKSVQLGVGLGGRRL